MLLRLEGRVFFANAERIGKRKTLSQEGAAKSRCFGPSPVFGFDYTDPQTLTVGEEQPREGVRLRLGGMNPQSLGVMQRSQLGQAFRRDAMHFTLERSQSQNIWVQLACRCRREPILEGRRGNQVQAV